MRCLVLVKHSTPALEPRVPPDRWRLSEIGRRRAAALADTLTGWNAASLYSSDEPKAIETAEIISSKLGLPVKVVPGFREHLRNGVPFMTDAKWRVVVLNAINRPDQLVLGSETVEEARRRFSDALTIAESMSPPGAMIIVSHGTVISMFIARLTGADPASMWERLGLPGLVVVTWPSPGRIEHQQNFDSVV